MVIYQDVLPRSLHGVSVNGQRQVGFKERDAADQLTSIATLLIFAQHLRVCSLVTMITTQHLRVCSLATMITTLIFIRPVSVQRKSVQIFGLHVKTRMRHERDRKKKDQGLVSSPINHDENASEI